MAAESIGNLESTKIPGYSDAADIQAALRVYHYGSYDYDPTNTDPAELVNPSIAYTLNNLQDQIDSVGGISEDILTAKGALISATAASTPAALSVGSNGQVLTANNATSTGLQWATPEVTLTNTATLVNKTLTSPVISTISNTGTLTLPTSTDTLVGRATTDTLTNKTISMPVVISPEERCNIVASAATGTINVDVMTSAVWYYTSNATANFTLNFRGNSGTTLNSLLAVGDSINIVFLNTNGTTAFYPSTIQIDGSAVTPRWQGGTAPTAGNTSSIDVYVFTVIKTAATPTYVALASQTRFA